MVSKNGKHETYTTDFLSYDVEKAAFFDHPAIDALVSSIVAMGSEVWSAQRRIKVLESVLTSQGISLEKVNQYQPTAEEEKAWRVQRDQFIKRVYGSLEKTGEARTQYGAGMDSLRQGG
ncbi:hypothetical protein [uncultured Parasphingorhabdus sp.]|uniref:hypothetical protein n=1 Tax=uncultured Parasphingorhabdus sp. TaxID=2709694 RepID=UPI002AA812AF|nr:hypothetical protein [uncultured Parasphingorhabdus sp.]